MADIFIIILVFLLKSYATGTLNLSPSKGTILPEAKIVDSSAVEALKVEISDSAVIIEGTPVANIQKYSFNSSDIEKNGSSKLLNIALSNARKRQVLISKTNSDVKPDSRVIVIANKHAPYSTIKTVLASAAVNGYTDFKLAVINSNQ